MRKAHLGQAALALLLTLGPAVAATAAPAATMIRACILAAASLYSEPPAVLLILLNVEGGPLGAVSHNTNGTVDIGPMQVNQIWIPTLASHWHATERATFLALRDNFCANVEAGAWILRHGLDEANGDFWGGVGYYHSHDPGYEQAYLHAVLKQALRLEALAQRAQPSKPSAQQASLPSGNGGG